MKTFNIIIKYVWLITGLAAIIFALFGAWHQLFTALVCFLFYIAALSDIRRENARARNNNTLT